MHSNNNYMFSYTVDEVVDKEIEEMVEQGPRAGKVVNCDGFMGLFLVLKLAGTKKMARKIAWVQHWAIS